MINRLRFPSFVLLCLLATLSSCKESPLVPIAKQQLIKEYFSQQVKMIDSSMAVDSFDIVRIDTLTERERLLAEVRINSQRVDRYEDLIKKKLALGESELRLAKLYTDISLVVRDSHI